MKYFCAKCKCCHEVEDIAVDMWSICRDDIIDAIQNLLLPPDNADQDLQNGLFQVSNALVAYLNSTRNPDFFQKPGVRVNGAYGISYRKRGLLQGAWENNQVTGGVYEITLDRILSSFTEYARAQGRKEDLEAIRRVITPGMRRQFVYRRDLRLTFFPNHAVDRVTDAGDIPFPDSKGRLRGFHHICSHCGCSISGAAGRAEETVVALAGSPRAGKTSCMIAMIASLLAGSCPGVQVVPLPQDPKWQELMEELSRYQRGIKITKTPAVQSQVPAQSLLVQLGEVQPVQRVLTVVDMPGEFWQGGSGLTGEFFRQYAGIYENIDCIWFVASKATVRMSNAGEVPDQVKVRLAKDTAEDMEVIRRANPMNLGANLQMLRSQLEAKLQRPMPPTMVIVTKPDYLVSQVDREDTGAYGLFPVDSSDVPGENAAEYGKMLTMERGTRYVLRQDALYAHAQQVRQFIGNANRQFLQAVENNCPDRFYVSLSPYGRPARDEDQQTGMAPTPYHELLPFIWTMAITGGIRVRHKCKWLRRGLFRQVVGDETTEESIAYHHDRRNSLTAKDKQTLEDRNAIYRDITNNLLMHPDRQLDAAGRAVGIHYIPYTTIQHGRT